VSWELLEGITGSEGLVGHAGLLGGLRALVQLTHEALVSGQLRLGEWLTEVEEGGDHYCEDGGVVRGYDVDGIAFGR